jgi:hypothetical protein
MPPPPTILTLLRRGRFAALASWLVVGAFGAAGAVAVAGEIAVREVELSWPAVDGARGYELELRPKDDDAAGKEYSVAAPAWKATLPSGLYQLRMRTLDERGVPGRWSAARPLVVPYPAVQALAPKMDAVLTTAEPDRAEVTLKWRSLGEAARYRVEISNAKAKVLWKATTDEPEASTDLPVSASYQWRVTAITADGTAGDVWEAPRRFVLKGPALERPEIIGEYESDTPVVKWSKPKYASHFKVKLTVKDDASGEWKTLVEEPTYDKSTVKIVESWPKGQYRLDVAAAAPLRDASKETRYSFETGVRAALKGKRKSAHRLQAGYAYAPGVRTVKLRGVTSDIGFYNVMLNSHVLSASYTYLAFPHALGVELTGHLARATMFETEDASALAEQEPISLANDDVRLLGRYGLTIWRFAPVVVAGAERRTVHRFFAEGLTAFGMEPLAITDALVGGGLDLILDGGHSLGLFGTVASAVGQDELEDYQRQLIVLRYAKRILDDRFTLSLAASQDESAFSFHSPATGEPYYSVWASRLLMAGLAYSF